MRPHFILFALLSTFSSAAVADQKPSTKLDVVFVMDATGSMQDEVDQVKNQIWSIANTLVSHKSKPDIRFGLVMYKDQADDFLVKSVPFTSDVDAIHKQLMSVTVDGGDDTPEHVGAGLHEALGMAWRAKSEKLVYLVGDARSQSYDDGKDVKSALSTAKEKGIEIHTVACSGISPEGSDEFRSISAKTNGKFQVLTYHSVAVGEGGRKHSIVRSGGKIYESTEVLSKEEWSKGAEVLVREKKLRPRMKRSRPVRESAPENNSGDLLLDSIESEL